MTKNLKAKKDSFIAGSISKCMENSKEITSEKWILQTVSRGASIELKCLASTPLSTASKTCNKKFRKSYVSSIFLREKKDRTTHRLILNLKKFNKNKVHRHFKMGNLSTIINMIRQDCYMAKIDPADAYYIVPVVLCMDQKYLLFQFEGNLYKYTCLPNGLSSVFIKILKPVFSASWKEGHLIMGYFDNTFLMGRCI